MRFIAKIGLLIVMSGSLAHAQGGAPGVSRSQDSLVTDAAIAGALPEAPPPAAQPKMLQMKALIKTQMKKVIDGKQYPAVSEWEPLTARQKFDVFLHSTYSPVTFLNAGVDVAADRAKGRNNPEYETGMRGWGQHYGIELATSETDVFFQRFLFPTLLRQDPRYYRNPDLPFFRRVLYSMSRVVITRSDKGGETFNGSRILGSAASRALADLYVPGEAQGMRPVSQTVRFALLRDAGMNLVHEFWPDLRHKFLHR